VARPCDDTVDKKWVNSCVLKQLFGGNLKPPKTPKYPGNAFSSALLMSIFQNFAGKKPWRPIFVLSSRLVMLVCDLYFIVVLPCFLKLFSQPWALTPKNLSNAFWSVLQRFLYIMHLRNSCCCKNHHASFLCFSDLKWWEWGDPLVPSVHNLVSLQRLLPLSHLLHRWSTREYPPDAVRCDRS